MPGGMMQVYRSFIKMQLNRENAPVRKFISDFRNNRDFNSVLGFLRQTRWRSGEWHREYQNRRFKDLIEFTLKNVPYYREYARERGIDSANISSIDNLGNLPVINEFDLRKDTGRFLPGNAGGTRVPVSIDPADSDSPRIAFDSHTIIEEGAMIARHFENAGFKIGSPVICFVDTIEDGENEEYYHDKISGRHYFSSGNLGRKNLSDYCAKIKELRSGFICGYPRSLETLADLVLEWEIDLKFQGAVTTGDILTGEIRKKIERAFETKVYDLYRFRLPVAGMGQCHYCDGYHIFSEFCIIELLDFDGKPVARKGEMGRIVVTNLSNRRFPIIRFETGDVGILDGADCDCGMGMPRIIKEVIGSRNDLLINSDGRYLSPQTLQDALIQAGYSRPGYQLVQQDRHNFKLTLERDPVYAAENLDKINSCLLDKLVKDSELIIEMVDNVGPRGKAPRPFVREYNPGRV
jgi:phenylacetate-CoA ligase